MLNGFNEICWKHLYSQKYFKHDLQIPTYTWIGIVHCHNEQPHGHTDFISDSNMNTSYSKCRAILLTEPKQSPNSSDVRLTNNKPRMFFESIIRFFRFLNHFCTKHGQNLDCLFNFLMSIFRPIHGFTLSQKWCASTEIRSKIGAVIHHQFG